MTPGRPHQDKSRAGSLTQAAKTSEPGSGAQGGRPSGSGRAGSRRAGLRLPVGGAASGEDLSDPSGQQVAQRRGSSAAPQSPKANCRLQLTRANLHGFAWSSGNGPATLPPRPPRLARSCRAGIPVLTASPPQPYPAPPQSRNSWKTIQYRTHWKNAV